MANAENADALFRLGQEAARRREWRRAAKLFAQAAEREPGNPSYHLAHAQSLQLAGLDARGPYQWTLALHPDCVEAHWGMAMECMRTGDSLQALKWLHRYVETRVKRGDRSPRAAPAEPAQIPATTLVCVDCRNYELAADAMQRTLQQCRFERAIFFSDADIRVEGVQTIRIPPIRSIAEYSLFMLKELERHVTTDYALVMQWDGYVLDGRYWSADFQRYDYVGAPWPAPEGASVGNGGFSLRSRRLLRALQDPEFEARTPEDIAICRTYRAALESRHAIRFAPTEVAARFSFETLTPPGPTFGFHGVVHLAHLFGMTDAELADYRPAPLQVIVTKSG